MAKTIRAQCLEAIQLLRRLEECDDNGYCSCVTCGETRKWNDLMDGGHFIDKSHSSFWALEEVNINPQCKKCNGNGMRFGTARYSYQKWMEGKHGELFVQNMIETKKHLRKISAQGYRDMLADFKERIKFHKNRIGA